MKIIQEFEFPGYMSTEARDFFGDKLTCEQRDGIPVVGHFIELLNGSTYMPSKGDKFIKYENGSIMLL